MRNPWKIISRYIVRYIRYWGNDTAYMRSLGMQIGAGSGINLRKVHVGSEPYLIRIGRNVTITYGVILLTHDGANRLFRHKHPQLNSRFGNRFGTIIIGDNSFIGAGAIVLPGVEIGENSIIGAGSVVTGNIPSNSLAVGNPARVIKTIDEYFDDYMKKYIPIEAKTTEVLKEELTAKLWGNQKQTR